MKNILLTFVGNHDPFDPVDGSDGPILNLISAKSFDKIYLFYNSDNYLKRASDLNQELIKRSFKIDVVYIAIEIKDPTDYTLLYPLINNACQKILNENKKYVTKYFIALASGTPQMHTIWVLLQQSKLFPAKLLQAIDKRYEVCDPPYREVTFEINNFPSVVSPDEIKRLLNISELKRERLEAERKSLTRDFGFSNIIGKSELLLKEIEKAARISENDIPVLIIGETGTGKELFARAVHYSSHRREKPFICVNCAALPETLTESELFGHVKGAFTGAVSDRKGKFQLADEGTIFLDEIGDMPLSTQAKILRVLQDGEITPVGSEKLIKVNVRIISATNKDLDIERNEKRFREDLFYRIKGLTINLPPLRRRKEDILLLANYFLDDKFSLSREARKLLYDYFWAGNVRELKLCLETAMALSKDKEISFDIITDQLQQQSDRLKSEFRFEMPATNFDLKNMLESIEKQAIVQALNEEKNNQSQAAKQLGMTRQNLKKKLGKYSIAT